MFMYGYFYVCSVLMFRFHRANWHFSTTLTEVFRVKCFLSCKANASV
jgi:hypothetical protein